MKYRQRNDELRRLYVERPIRLCHSLNQSHMAKSVGRISHWKFTLFAVIFELKCIQMLTCPPPSGKRIVSSKTTLYPLTTSAFPSALFCFIVFGSHITTFDSNFEWKLNKCCVNWNFVESNWTEWKYLFEKTIFLALKYHFDFNLELTCLIPTALTKCIQWRNDTAIQEANYKNLWLIVWYLSFISRLVKIKTIHRHFY